MSFMKADIQGPTDWWEVETHEGTFFVMCRFVGYNKEDVTLEKLKDYVPVADVGHILDWERIIGWGARLSAPGYQDCTEWCVYDTEQEARAELAQFHDLCPICLEDEFQGELCMVCVQQFNDDELHSALTEYLADNVTYAEIVSMYYDTLMEAFNNEVLKRIYETKVTEHDSKPPERCGDCENCKQLEQVKQRVLAAVNPPFSHADDGVTNLWNTELARLPCTGQR